MGEPAIEHLRARDLGELLDAAFRLWRRRFGLFAGIGVAVSVPVAVAGALWNLMLLRALPPTETEPIPADFFETLALTMALMPAILLMQWCLWAAAAMLVTAAVVELLRGGAVSFSGVLASALPRVPAAIGATIVSGVPVLIGMLMCLVPGIVLLILFALTLPIVYIERRGPISSIGRSVELVTSRGAPGELPSWVRVLVVGLVTVVVYYVLSFLAALPQLLVLGTEQILDPFRPAAAGAPSPALLIPLQVVGGALQGLFAALILIPWPLVYFDLRARREGHDLERAAEALVGEAPSG